MARWDARIRKKLKKLKVGRNKVEEGVYIDTNVFDEFVSWLHAKKFQEPANNELKKSAFLSPDGKWLISFRQTAKDYVFAQLADFETKASLSGAEDEVTPEMENADAGDGE